MAEIELFSKPELLTEIRGLAAEAHHHLKAAQTPSEDPMQDPADDLMKRAGQASLGMFAARRLVDLIAQAEAIGAMEHCEALWAACADRS